ncbi:hypothetical protein BDZ89DRAFT_313683 [Hymenopellis radicata]|nr:hypothetical protein BDZ89DRAFT_313683 [Hymenopellis radicata]
MTPLLLDRLYTLPALCSHTHADRQRYKISSPKSIASSFPCPNSVSDYFCVDVQVKRDVHPCLAGISADRMCMEQ